MTTGNPAIHALMADYYRAMGEGDFAHVVSLHDPEVVCWMSGTALVSGRFEGRDALYAHMSEHVLGTLDWDAEGFVKGSRVVFVDGDIGVGLLHGGLPATDGNGRYDQYYIQVFRYENGLIREIVELYDTAMVEQQLFRNPPATARAKPADPFELDSPGLASSLDRAGTVALAERFAASLGSGAVEGLAPDAEIRVVGWTPLSGRTRDAGVLAQLVPCAPAFARVVAAGPEGAVILARDATLPGQQYAFLVEVSGDKIGCVSVFLDTARAEVDLFGNSFPTGTSQGIKPPFDVAATLGEGVA